MVANLSKDIEELSDTRSPKRRAAAKRLRKAGDPRAGPALLSALQVELQDARTWETQYQMIMAIGSCGYEAALPFLESLLPCEVSGMVEIAIGDAILRLSRKHEKDAGVAIKFIEANNRLQTQGAMEAIAMLRMVPEEPILQRLVDHGLSLSLGDDDWTVIWLLRAAPGWPIEVVAPLLDKWGEVSFLQDQQIVDAVDLARKRKYYNWSPL